MQFAFDFGDVSEGVVTSRPSRKTRVPLPHKGVVQDCQPRPKRRRGNSFFFALGPDCEVAQGIKRVVESFIRPDLVIWPKKNHMPHISLLGLGAYDDVPRDYVAAIAKITDRFSHAGFDVSFDTLMRFRGSDAVVLTGGDDEGIRSFRLSLRDVLRDAGLPVAGGSSFTPHMTMLYSTSPFKACRVPAVRWHADEFFLIHSIVGGSKHIVLGRWPLKG
jgi:2'-5' RNA ligase